MSKTKIEWVLNKDGSQRITLNPVVGCFKSCWYCYGKPMNDRFKLIPKWTEPKFFPERLEQPIKRKKPTTYFVGSMSDIFHDKMPEAWIDKIIDMTHKAPQHKFMFLTKNPKRYKNIEFPENCWLGVTITDFTISYKTYMTMHYYTLLIRLLYNLSNKKNKLFLSFEPLMGNIFLTKSDLDLFDLIIIGAMTGQGKNNVIPKKEWIKSIIDYAPKDKIFFKDNIKPYLKQYGMGGI